jgi:hypothetical protein
MPPSASGDHAVQDATIQLGCDGEAHRIGTVDAVIGLQQHRSHRDVPCIRRRCVGDYTDLARICTLFPGGVEGPALTTEDRAFLAEE